MRSKPGAVPPAVARTSARAQWLPSRRAPSFPRPQDRNKTLWVARDVPVVVLAIPSFTTPKRDLLKGWVVGESYRRNMLL